nr:hypothetical protein [Tanacetum cinerariifolium]
MLQVLDFEALIKVIDQVVKDRLKIDYVGDNRQVVFTSYAWRRTFDICGEEAGSRMFEGHFVGRLAEHFRLLTDEGLLGINYGAPGTETQQDAAAGANQVDTENAGEGALGIPAPVQPTLGPQAASLATSTMPQRMSRLEEDVHGLIDSLGGQREVLDMLSQDFSRFTTWTVGRLSQMLDERGITYTSYGDYHMPYQRRTRWRSGDSSTSTALCTDDQSDP